MWGSNDILFGHQFKNCYTLNEENPEELGTYDASMVHDVEVCVRTNANKEQYRREMSDSALSNGETLFRGARLSSNEELKGDDGGNAKGETSERHGSAGGAMFDRFSMIAETSISNSKTSKLPGKTIPFGNGSSRSVMA